MRDEDVNETEGWYLQRGYIAKSGIRGSVEMGKKIKTDRKGLEENVPLRRKR